MNGVHETKSEIRARLDEIDRILGGAKALADGPVASFSDSTALHEVLRRAAERRQELEAKLEAAEEDNSTSIIRSHKALCQAKQMDEKAAYGNDPALYYTLGVCGEAGEMANAIVKAMRNGSDREKMLVAIKSELPDVIIYSHVLAYVLDIDLSKLVNDKVEVVVKRAFEGYYGEPLAKDVPGALK